MKIFKPDNLGFLSRSFRFGPRKRIAVGMMGFFNYNRSSLDGLLGEAQMWAAVAEALGQDVLDEGLPKTSGEFLVYGAAHAPNGNPVPQLPVSAKVGSAQKTLYVFGDRRFTLLGGVSAPQPFSRMAMGPQQSFGGAGFAANPAGLGLLRRADASGAEFWPLPNVESPSSLMLARDDRPAPAGFWALPSSAPERQRLLGVFDDRWLQQTWPHLPDDTRPDYFQTARPDQRISGFFRGDEVIEVGHMHPQRPLQTSSLPKLRARCFINRKVAGGTQFTELETRAETVWLLPEIECGIVLYRGAADITSEDADDVLHVMAEWENLSDAPLSFEHYEKLFRSRLPGAAAVAAPPSPVVAPVPAAAAMAVPAVAAVAVPTSATPAELPDPKLAELEKLIADIESETASLLKQHGLSKEDLTTFMKPPAEPAALSLPELEKAVAHIESESAALLKQANMTPADLAKAMAPPASSGPVSLADLKTAMQEIEQQRGDILKQSGMTEKSFQDFLASRPETAHLANDVAPPKADLDNLFAELEASEAASAAAAPAVVPVAAVAAPAAQAAAPALPVVMDRDYVIARHARKENFRSHDLSGLDLSGLDLAGADFSSALLEKTSFKDSRLTGAVFRDALLAGGDFSGADMNGTLLAGASAGAAVFAKTRMDGIDARKADFTGSDFSGAQLSNANLSDAVFDGSKMAGLNASNCNAHKASFAECDLAGAEMANARLTAVSFTDAKLGKAGFTGTACDNADFHGADATQANFTNANLRASRAGATSRFAGAQLGRSHLGRAAWEGVMLAGANLEGAVLDDADFSRATATDANFKRASAKGAKFDKSDLTRADFTGVNLFKGSLRHATTEAALLRRANLYGVDFYDTSPTIASLEGSNIDQTLLVIRKPLV